MSDLAPISMSERIDMLKQVDEEVVSYPEGFNTEGRGRGGGGGLFYLLLLSHKFKV